ncbi:MAG TPA: type II toxin-antitoxin system RelE/ParE family toxin [Thermomicrobiales bacterium]|nr:type II toxin-antitoxin system RelE/ParE family toxin [Thermomicrobiales bacterium]
MRWLTFVYFAHALRDDLLTDEDWQRIEWQLIVNPHAGSVIAGTGGARKLRVRLAGRGKRGGARMVYVYLTGRERIYFLATYAKNEQEDLSPADQRVIARLIERLRQE